MLKQRLITAAILIPLVIWLIFGLPTGVVAAVFGLIVLLGAWEWTKMVPCRTPVSQYGFMGVTTLLLFVGYLVSSSVITVTLLAIVACLWWLLVLVWLIQVRNSGYDATVKYDSLVLKLAGKLSHTPLDKALIGLLLLVPCFVSVLFLHSSDEFGPAYVFFCLSLMWAADSGAYFAGKKWGARKLAPGVSPGKTIEGVTGGLVASAVWTVLWMLVADLGSSAPLWFFIVAMVTAVISVAGDLFESLFKRIAQIKDSGQILPGHGGVLDRIDSLTAGAPVFVIGLMFL